MSRKLEMVILRGAGSHTFITAYGAYSVKCRSPMVGVRGTTTFGIDWWQEKYLDVIDLDEYSFTEIRYYSDPDEYRSQGWNKALLYDQDRLVKELWWDNKDDGDIYIFLPLKEKEKWLASQNR